MAALRSRRYSWHGGLLAIFLLSQPSALPGAFVASIVLSQNLALLVRRQKRDIRRISISVLSPYRSIASLI